MLQSFCEGRLFAERTGHAPSDVIGLHGWARSWQDLAGALGGFNALLIDLPGFGASPEPPEVWGSADYAALVAEVIADIHKPQVVVGHSFGGRVAVKLAACWPELVSGLVLTGVPLLRNRSSARVSWRYRAARWGSRHGIVSEARMETLRQRYGSDDYKRASGIMRSVLVRSVNESYEEDLIRIKCPVELVWGAKDTAAPLTVARQASELLGNVHLELIEAAAHLVPMSHPDAVRKAVDRALLASVP